MKLKKFIVITVICFAIGSLWYHGYKYFNTTSSLLGKIPPNAEQVAKVSLFKIKETLVLDALSSPSFYYKQISFKGKKKEKDTSIEKGIDLQPFSQPFYTLPEHTNTWFTVLPIANEKDFNAYIKSYTKEKNATIETLEAYQWVRLEKNKVVCAWTNEALIIAFTLKANDAFLHTAFHQALIQKELITDKTHPIIKELSEDENHLLFKQGKDKISLNFTDGAIILDGLWTTEGNLQFKKGQQIPAPENSSFSFFMDANLQHKENRDWIGTQLSKMLFLSKANIEVDSLLHYSTGVITLAVDGTTTQQDTVVTYEYDDNFEKVAVKKVQEKEVPQITLHLQTKESGLKQYLQSVKAVDLQDNFAAFPFYTLSVSETENQLQWSNALSKVSMQNRTMDGFMEANINIEKLPLSLISTKAEKLSHILSSLEVKGVQENDTTLNISAKIQAKEADINSASQLFFGLQEKP